MEEEKKKSAWKIWLYLTPVYILVAIPLVKWTIKINSSDMNLSKEDYNAFNSDEGEVKKTATSSYDPNLNDSGYALHYRSSKAGAPASLDDEEPARETQGAEPRGQYREEAPARQQGQPAQRQAAEPATVSASEAQKQFGLGQQKGLMTYAVGQAMGNPKAVGALFNNSYIVKGFMGRGTVKSALGSSQGLQNYLKNNPAAINNFLNNSVVKTAMNNPAVVNAFASSSMASSILASPGVQAMLANPDALASLAASNPKMAEMLSNPNVMNALMKNPETADVAASLGGMGGKNIPRK